MRRAARRVLWFWRGLCASIGQTKLILMARKQMYGHKKPDLFNAKYPKEVAIKLITNKQESFTEYQYLEFNAILFPLVLWLGRQVPLQQRELFPQVIEQRKFVVTDLMRSVFGLSKKSDKVLISFVTHEAPKMYRFDAQGKHVGHMTAYEVSEVIRVGCEILSKKMSGQSIQQIREKLTQDLERFKIPLLFSKVGRYLWNGRSDQMWYPHAHDELIRLLPDVEPKILFNILAGTSMNTSLQSNIKLFFRALGQYKHGTKIITAVPGMNKVIETEFRDMFSGAVYQLWHFFEYGRLNGRKISNFADALSGDVLAVVVDIWIMRVFGVDRQYRARTMEKKSRSPTKKMYDAIEYYIHSIAPILDLEPRQIQAMTWGGIRTEETGGGNKKTYTYFVSDYLHWNDLFIGENDVYVGSDGIHFGTQASRDYKGLLVSGVFTTE